MAALPKLKSMDPSYLMQLARRAPFVLQIGQRQQTVGPVLMVKERTLIPPPTRRLAPPAPAGRAREELRAEGLRARGQMGGETLQRCLPLIRRIVARVTDEAGVPLELERYLRLQMLRQPTRLPLDEEAGAKLALIFRLGANVADLDRAELIARRVLRFTREEATYWHSRITGFGRDADRWAATGLRIVLGGQPKDPAVARLLEELRTND
jgi:hypothetical protein